MTIDFELQLEEINTNSTQVSADLSKSLHACCHAVSDNTKNVYQQMKKMKRGEGNLINSPSTPKSKSILKHSSLKSESNPLSISRQTRINRGDVLTVSFNETVVVHAVPYWDPCGELFPDYFSVANDTTESKSVSKSVSKSETSVTCTIRLKPSNSKKRSFFAKIFKCKNKNKKKKRGAKEAALIFTIGVLVFICII